MHRAKVTALRNGVVVFDLDETVLDNSGFQAMLERSGLIFDKRLWDRWQKQEGDQVALRRTRRTALPWACRPLQPDLPSPACFQ